MPNGSSSPAWSRMRDGTESRKAQGYDWGHTFALCFCYENEGVTLSPFTVGAVGLRREREPFELVQRKISLLPVVRKDKLDAITQEYGATANSGMAAHVRNEQAAERLR